MKCSLTLMASMFTASGAGAQVSVDSRLNTLRDVYDDQGPFSWDETGTFTGVGTGTISLAHGATQTFSVTTSEISGTLAGYYSSIGGPGYYQRETTLDAVLTFATDTRVSITLNGNVSDGFPTNDPMNHNAYFHIDRTSGTPGAVFDAFTEGAPTAADVHGHQDWNSTVWTATLAAGTYRVFGGANGRYVDFEGSGTAYGSGQIAIDMTMISVPAPASGAFFAMTGVCAGRRRRK